MVIVIQKVRPNLTYISLTNSQKKFFLTGVGFPLS
jgi:hypothetical protein